MIDVKTLTRLLSLPACGLGSAARTDRRPSQAINDEQFEVLETGALWDESDLAYAGGADPSGSGT